jgi:ethanolamine ammonia-lyase large subunit
VTNAAAEGIDMVTLEARSYGVARHIRRRIEARNGGRPLWMIVNDVAGFIGPEVFRSPQQLLRTCLEDVVMAKLHGLTMGLDVCATFHMGIEPGTLQRLTQTIVTLAAPAYLMGVAGNADPMLGYLTTSYREHPALRRRAGRQIATAMARRLTALGVMDARGEPLARAETTASLYAAFHRAGGGRGDRATLRAHAHSRLRALQQAGHDLGYGHTGDYAAPPAIETRLKRIYAHARGALYVGLDDAVLRDVSPRALRVRSLAVNRARRSVLELDLLWLQFLVCQSQLYWPANPVKSRVRLMKDIFIYE